MDIKRTRRGEFDNAIIQQERRAREYFLRAYAGRPELFDDVWQRYKENYNGMRDHWDRTLPFILGTKEIPLNERRGQ